MSIHPNSEPVHFPARLAAAALLLAVVGASSPADAALGINYGSTANATNLKSDGSEMDVTFTFELGVFASGFTPGEENVDLWMANWRALPDADGAPSSAIYDPSPIFPGAPFRINNFEGTAVLDDNVSDPSTPYAPATRAYVWGFTGRGAEGVEEWILILNDSWRLPQVSVDDIPSTLDWAVSDAGTTAVIGSVNPSYASASDAPHLQSAEVVLASAPSIPEPRTTGLVAIALLAAAWRRSRPAAAITA